MVHTAQAARSKLAYRKKVYTEEDLKTGKTFGNWLKVRDVVQKRKLSVPREDDVTNRISEISFNYIYSRRESTLSSRDHQNLQVYQQDVKKENEKRKFKSPAVAAKTDGARDKWHRSFLNILDAKNRTKFQNLLELINRNKTFEIENILKQIEFEKTYHLNLEDMVKNLNKNEYDEIVESFEEYDSCKKSSMSQCINKATGTDKCLKGGIYYKQLNTVLRNFGMNFSDDEVELLKNKFLVDGQKMVSFSEFLNIYVDCHYFEPCKRTIAHWVGMFDYVDLDEIESILISHQQEHSEVDTKEIGDMIKYFKSNLNFTGFSREKMHYVINRKTCGNKS